MDMRVVLLLVFMVSMTLAKDLRVPFYDYEGNDEGLVDQGVLPIRDQRGCIRCERRFLSPVNCCNGQKCSFLHGCYS